MRKTHLMVLAIVLAVAILAVGAVGAYAGLADDHNPPVTTTDMPESLKYWDTAAIEVTATDDEGIRYIYHEFDEGIVRLATIDGSPTSTTLAVPTDKDMPLAVGTHKFKYWAQDVNGNVEAQQTVTFEILKDTVKPTTTAYAASVIRGRTATLRYKVRDAQPTKGTATAVIKIKTRSGKVVKTINAGSKAVNTVLSVKFRCTLTKGTYRFYVYAIDASGNKQAKVGYNKLTVR